MIEEKHFAQCTTAIRARNSAKIFFFALHILHLRRSVLKKLERRFCSNDGIETRRKVQDFFMQKFLKFFFFLLKTI